MTLRTSNGKRFNWWIPIEDIDAHILKIHVVPTDKVTIVRGEKWGEYIVSYYGEKARSCNEIDIYIKKWAALN